MDFFTIRLESAHVRDAYERLLLECVQGDANMYARADEWEAALEICGLYWKLLENSHQVQYLWLFRQELGGHGIQMIWWRWLWFGEIRRLANRYWLLVLLVIQALTIFIKLLFFPCSWLFQFKRKWQIEFSYSFKSLTESQESVQRRAFIGGSLTPKFVFWFWRKTLPKDWLVKSLFLLGEMSAVSLDRSESNYKHDSGSFFLSNN